MYTCTIKSRFSASEREANAVMKRRLPALSAGTRVSFAGNCRKQKPQID